jgi:hypothetical protein
MSQFLDAGQIIIALLDRRHLHWLTQQHVVDHRRSVAATAAAGQLLTYGILHSLTGYADDKDALPLDLLLGQEDIDRPAVTGLDDDGYAGRFLTSFAGFLLVVEIGDQVVDTRLVQDQLVGAGRIIDKGGAGNAPRTGLVSNDAVHLFAFQEMASLVSQSLGQRLVDWHIHSPPLENRFHLGI